MLNTVLLKELGNLPVKKETKFYYEITNQGLEPIQINKITVGCGSCTTAHMTSNVIRPNKSEFMYVTFTPGTTGDHKKYINIRYSDKELLKVEFTAHVYEEG